MHTSRIIRSALTVCSLLPLVSGFTLAAPSSSAPSMVILAQGGTLCYSANITVNDNTDAALSKQAEAIMLKTLNGLALSAAQYDVADTCDRELIFVFSVANAEAPTVYTNTLELDSYAATDGPVKLIRATVWTEGYWGGDAKVLSRAIYTRKMQTNLVRLLSKFTADYRSVIK